MTSSMIEVEKTYKVTLTEEQLRYLYLILDSKNLSGTVINPFYHKLKEIYDNQRNEDLDEIYYKYEQ
jgi:hypothetical protein